MNRKEAQSINFVTVFGSYIGFTDNEKINIFIKQSFMEKVDENLKSKFLKLYPHLATNKRAGNFCTECMPNNLYIKYISIDEPAFCKNCNYPLEYMLSRGGFITSCDYFIKNGLPQTVQDLHRFNTLFSTSKSSVSNFKVIELCNKFIGNFAWEIII